MKFLYFFLFLWAIFALLDLDPDPTNQINADPDPKFWLNSTGNMRVDFLKSYYFVNLRKNYRQTRESSLWVSSHRIKYRYVILFYECLAPILTSLG
jgi:hypothetical protein